MTIEILQENILKLPIEERISFAKLILESLETKTKTKTPKISLETKLMLDKRLAAIEQEQGKFTSWEEVKQKARVKINNGV